MKVRNRLKIVVLLLCTLIMINRGAQTYAATYWTNVNADNIDASSARLAATFNEATDSNVNNYRFEYTTDSSFSTNVTSVVPGAIRSGTSNGTPIVDIRLNLSSLSQGTTYYFRAIYQSSNYSHTSAPYPSFTTETPEIIASSTQLSEQTLSGNVIALNLEWDNFKNNISSNIQLNNEPPGTTIGAVDRPNNNTVYITLNYDGTDFDTDYPNFTITALGGGLAGGVDITSNSIKIYALNEIAGLANYTATGEANPTSIEMAGYNGDTKELHINTRLHTNLDVTGKVATFKYFVRVYDSSGNEIGNLGDIHSPLTIRTRVGNEVDLNDLVIPLNQQLPIAYRIVVIVESVTVN